MNTFSLFVILWQISLVVSVITFLYGIFRKSWILMLISFITSIPVAYYFNGANNGWRLIALTPILFLILTITFGKRKIGRVNKEII